MGHEPLSEKIPYISIVFDGHHDRYQPGIQVIKIADPMRAKPVSSFILLVALPAEPGGAGSNGTAGYLIGGIIALLIMGYLVYTLMRPEKF
jgi:K+-transporting ATPase KdpF subunit